MKIVEGGKKEVEPRSGCPDTPTNDAFMDWYKKNTPRSKNEGKNCAEVFLGARKGPVNALGRLGPGSGTLRDDWEDWNVQGVTDATLGTDAWEDNIMGEFVTPENVQLYIKEEVTAERCANYDFLFQDSWEDCYKRNGDFRSMAVGTVFDNPQSAKKVNDLQALKAMTFYYDLGDGKIEADFFVPSKNIEDDASQLRLRRAGATCCSVAPAR